MALGVIRSAIEEREEKACLEGSLGGSSGVLEREKGGIHTGRFHPGGELLVCWSSLCRTVVDVGSGGDGRVVEWRREESEEKFEEAIATEFVGVVKIINGAAPLRSHSRWERCREILVKEGLARDGSGS